MMADFDELLKHMIRSKGGGVPKTLPDFVPRKPMQDFVHPKYGAGGNEMPRSLGEKLSSGWSNALGSIVGSNEPSPQSPDMPDAITDELSMLQEQGEEPTPTFPSVMDTLKQPGNELASAASPTWKGHLPEWVLGEFYGMEQPPPKNTGPIGAGPYPGERNGPGWPKSMSPPVESPLDIMKKRMTQARVLSGGGDDLENWELEEARKKFMGPWK